MDTMIQLYLEKTEEMLQKAEESLIRLESEYSSDDINELFRIAHTIKGSSQLVGFEDIGNIMHKIEDMLDCARNGTIQFNQSIVSLSFEGLDIVKKLLQHKKEMESEEMGEDLISSASEICETILAFINSNKKKEEKTVEQPLTGIVSSLICKHTKGKNKYYITFFLEEDTPMVSPVFIMILKSIEEIGTLVYSSVTDSYLEEDSCDEEIKSMHIILSTDIEESELYTYFALSYIEKINIVDLTRSKLEENDYYFNNNDNTSYFALFDVFIKLYNIFFSRPHGYVIKKEELQVIESIQAEAVKAFDKLKIKNKIGAFVKDFNELSSIIMSMYEGQLEIDEKLCADIRAQMAKLIERANNFTKGKHILRIFKPEKNDFINRLKSFIGMVGKSSTLIILIDLSNLDILHENEVKALIEIKKQLEAKGIRTGIITEGCESRRIINIFDSIIQVEEFNLFKSDLEAFIWMLRTQGFS